jgi:putative SOS response-associated peptidase YedK
MCGRFTLTLPSSEIEARFNARFVPEYRSRYQPRFNAAPTQELPIILEGKQSEIVPARWGLVPHWAKDLQIGSRMINARAETLGEKPAFKSLLGARRCLIPADGFYEWKNVGSQKLPFRCTMTDGLFAFAGLWDEWRDPEGKAVRSFTIITCAPNGLLALIHDRMPVILDREQEQRWLDARVQEVGTLLRPYPDARMSLTPVSNAVNDAKRDSPDLIRSIASRL